MNSTITEKRKRTTLWVVFYFSLLAIVGSFYLSSYGDPLANLMSGDLRNELNAIAACDLCRYIRIAIFPLPLISGIALWKKDYKVVDTIILLSVLGLFFAVYKYGMQYRERGNILCDRRATVPCSSKDIEYLGFINMAFLGITAFASFIILGLWSKKN